jgi:hypothetical protein
MKRVKVLRRVKLPEGPVKVVLEKEGLMMMLSSQKKSAARADPEFWSARWGEIYERLYNCPFPVRPLGDFISYITYGQVGERARYYVPDGDVLYATPRNIPPTCTGIDPYLTRSLTYVNSPLDNARSRVQTGDILLVKDGVASVGRVVAFSQQLPFILNIDQHIALIRLDSELISEAATISILTRYVQAQIQRLVTGVGTATLDFDEIRSLHVPIFSKELQGALASQYHCMVSFHELAIQAKAVNDTKKANRNLFVAGGMLETLIWQVEKLIEGERQGITSLLPEGVPEEVRQAIVSCYRGIGERHRILERERRRGRKRTLGIPLERYPEIAFAVRKLLQQIEEIQAGRRDQVEPIFEGG